MKSHAYVVQRHDPGEMPLVDWNGRRGARFRGA